MTAAPFGEVVEFWGCITAHWRLPLGSCLKLRSSLTYGLHLPSIDRPRNRAGKFFRALLRRLAQAVAGDPLGVRVVVRNPGHSRRARVPLSCGWRAPRHHGNPATLIIRPANIMAAERMSMCLPPAVHPLPGGAPEIAAPLCRGRNFLGPDRQSGSADGSPPGHPRASDP